EYLENFPGVVITVSHDRYFLDKVVDELIVFEGEGKVSHFYGNYSEYIADLNTKKQSAKRKKQTEQAEPKKKEKTRLSYHEQKETKQKIKNKMNKQNKKRKKKHD